MKKIIKKLSETKISQYNWNWWFVINSITMCCLLVASLVISDLPLEQQKEFMHNITIGMAVLAVSFMPCLYIGLKNSES